MNEGFLSTLRERVFQQPALGRIKDIASLNKPPPLYLVGGAVRDGVLGRPIEDFDIVVCGDARTFAELYTDPRAISYPVFISADSILHLSRLVFDGVLRTTEQDYLSPELAMLEQEMFDLSWAQYEELLRLTVTPQQQRMKDTALRNASYFAVALSLLDPSFTPPDVISPVVSAESASTRYATSPR